MSVFYTIASSAALTKGSFLILRDRDEQILMALARCVRFFSLKQVAKTWYPNSLRLENARRRLAQLIECDFLSSRVVFAQQVQPTEPVFVWRPGIDGPSAGSVSWKLKKRWSGAPSRLTVYFATKRTAIRFGAIRPGRLTLPDQASHDFALAEVYLRYHASFPNEVPDWVGEDILRTETAGEKVPDSVLRSETKGVYRVIELGGSYSAARVRSFHDDCQAKGLPYELW